ncbi:TPA: hypothetical protein ACKQJM_003210 [Serratia marcescens]
MTEQELYDYAVSLLAKKNYASGEMHRQLSRLTESTGDITRVLRRLTDNHALDDARLLAYLLEKHVKFSSSGVTENIGQLFDVQSMYKSCTHLRFKLECDYEILTPP